MATACRVFVLVVLLSCSHIERSFAADAPNLGQQLLNIENIADKNQALAEVALLLQDSTILPLNKLSVLTAQGQLYYQLGKLDKAIDSALNRQKIASKHNFEQLEADAYKSVGVYAYYKGNNSLALKSYQQALSYYLTINEPIAQANLYNNIGLVYGAMGNLIDALSSYQQAEPLYQEFGSKRDKIDIRFNIAIFHLQLKRFDIAISMFKEVIERREEISDVQGLAMAYGDLGSAYKYAGDYRNALHFLTKSLGSHRQNKDDYNAAGLLHNLAELSNDLNNTAQAIEYAQEGIIKSKEQGHDNALVGSLYSLAKAYFQQGKFDAALSYVRQSTELSEKMQYKEQIKHNLALQALIFAAKNQTLEAADSHRKFIQAHIEMANDQLNSQLALFDSEQLIQQVDKLKQQKRLQELEMESSEQERNFIFVLTFSALLIGFLVARRNTEHRSKQALESKVKQRTNELEYLMQELQSANNIKSQFLANMSHEIRTPLTTVIGQAEAIISGDVDEKYLMKEVGIIHGNSLYLLELTNNILDLSKIEANKIELELKAQNLHDILQELANMFTLQATSKGLTFEIVHNLVSPFVIEIDGFRVKQILINLCSNAIKFTTKGHVELKIIRKDGRLIFKITDSGIGMSSSQLHNLFESFTQGDSSISRRFGGTGLGLCLSDQLAKIMGGTIEVESELNQGSVFAFSLPCSANSDNLVAESKVAVSNENSHVLQEQLQGTILLADDHNDNRRLIARLLASLGLNVITARNGREAVALFEQHQPQLILMDIQMPEMDGVEAFKIIRQRGCETPIFALTANAMSHEIEHYLSLGFNGHLSKPIERDIFVPTIAKYYEGDISTEKANENFNKVAISDLVQEFKSNLVLEQQDLILHINNDDFEQLARLSHRIAGAAQMFGFANLSTYALQLEMAIKNNQTNIVNAHTQDLLNEIDQVLW
jgi:signal transduction histidine kinase/CheY-like chemotaxis protein/HPt (histidine-containing phosphotransfer) domain-containing protein